MAEMVTLTLKLSPASRVIALAHNGHVAREPTMTITTMGQHLGRGLGSEYFAVGLFSFSGEAWAWNPAGTVREANKLSPAPAFLLEDVVLDQDGDTAAFVPLTNAPPALATWLKTPRFVREFGAQSSGDDKDLLLRNIPQAFDGVIVVKTGTATTPLPALAPPPATN
jgi:erythromycin esterase-like protein